MYWGSDTFGRGKQTTKLRKTKVSNKPSKIKSKHYKPNENSVNSFIFDLDIKLQIKSSSKKEGSQKIPKYNKKGGQ